MAIKQYVGNIGIEIVSGSSGGPVLRGNVHEVHFANVLSEKALGNRKSALLEFTAALRDIATHLEIECKKESLYGYTR